MNQPQDFSRFCPKCGAKVRGTEEIFATPQTCPNCKSKVLFWDVTKEPLGDLLEAVNVKPLIGRRAVVAIAITSVGIGLLVLLLFAVGVVDLAFFLSMIFVFSGGYCIAIFLGQQYKLTKQSKELQSLLKAV